VLRFNLGLVMRKYFGIGKPRRLQGLLRALLRLFFAFLERLTALWHPLHAEPTELTAQIDRSPGAGRCA